MKRNTIATITALLFAVATAGGFYWLWTISKTGVSTASPDTTYAIVEIESVKTEATNILTGLENIAGIPIPVPTAKMGKTNPFVNY